MNVLQVGSYLFPDLVGGAEISAENIHGVLTSAGHHVVRLRSGRGSLSPSTTMIKVDECEWVAQSWRPMAPIEAGSPPQKVAFYTMEFVARLDRSSLRKLIVDEAIDVAIVHSTRGIGYDFLPALADMGVPTVIFLHDLGLVCMNKSRVRNGNLCKSTCAQCRVVRRIARDSLSRMTDVALVGPSQQIVDLVRAELDIDGLQSEHIPNPNRYGIVPRIRSGSQRPFTIGFVGRLDDEKGLAECLPVVDALAATDDIRFLIAGAGSLEQAVIDFSAARPWVDFRGYVPPAETAAVYDAIDLLLMPSLWPENFPGAAVQAMTSGSPVVGFAVGGIPEIVQDDHSGILVPFKDFDALRDAVAGLLRDPARFERLSAGAIASAKRFDPDHLASRLIALVEKVAQTA